MANSKKWIQKATAQNKGALRKSMGVKKGQTIPKRKLKAAAGKSGVTGKRARLAMTLSKLRGGK